MKKVSIHYMTPIRFIKILSALLACFCVTGPFYGQGSEKPLTPVEQVERSINENNRDEAVSNLEKLKKLPSEPLRKKFIEYATEKNNRLFREKLLELYLEHGSPEADYFKPELSLVLRPYLKENLSQANHTAQEVAEINRALKLVKKYKLKDSFYEVMAYGAFPLLQTRRYAYDALSVIGDDRMFPILNRLINSENAVERTYAIDAFYYIKDERITPVLLKALKDENKSVRYYAVRTLENLEISEAIPYFIRIIREDVSPEVRVRAVRVMQNRKPRSAFYTLTRAVDDKSPAVRKAVVHALMAYDNDSAAYFISKQLEKEKVKELRVEQIKALDSLEHSGGGHGLKHVLTEVNNDTQARLWALYAAGRIGDHRLYDEVQKNLKHSDEVVRIEAAAALGNYKDDDAAEDLLQIIEDKDENYSVQSAALYALKKIDHGPALPRLFEISESHSNEFLRDQTKTVLRYILNKRFSK